MTATLRNSDTDTNGAIAGAVWLIAGLSLLKFVLG